MSLLFWPLLTSSVRSAFNIKDQLYAPTFFYLQTQSLILPKPYSELKRPRIVKGKRKNDEVNPYTDPELGEDPGRAEIRLEIATVERWVGE